MTGGITLKNKGHYLNALPAGGEVTLLAVVTEKELRPKRNAGVYLHLRLADRTGELDARVWERPEEIAQMLERDQVVKVRGTVEQYNDKPQLVVARIRRCEPQEFCPEDFCATSKQDPEAMYGQLQSYVERIERPPLRELLRSMVSDPVCRQAEGGACGAENTSRLPQRLARAHGFAVRASHHSDGQVSAAGA